MIFITKISLVYSFDYWQGACNGIKIPAQFVYQII